MTLPGGVFAQKGRSVRMLLLRNPDVECALSFQRLHLKLAYPNDELEYSASKATFYQAKQLNTGHKKMECYLLPFAWMVMLKNDL